MTHHTPINAADRSQLPRGLLPRRRNPAFAHEALIVRSVKVLVDAIDRADEENDEAGRRHANFLDDCRRNEIVPVEAKTPELAVLQLAMAIGELDRFDASWIADDAGNESLSEIQRLAESVLAFLETATGVSRESVGAEYFAGQRVRAAKN